MEENNNTGLKVIVSFILVIAIGIAGFLGYKFYQKAKPVVIEDLIGKNADYIYKYCGSLDSKYSCNLVFEESSDFQEGFVFEQSIKKGETLKDKLTIKISTGKKQVTETLEITSTTTVDDVELWANKNGISKTFIINEESETVAKGIVIRIEVAENELNEKVVNIIVSTGNGQNSDADIEVKYGEYIGLSEDEFKTKAKKLKLTANHKESQDAYSDTVEKGKIVWHGSGLYVLNEDFNYGLSKGKNPGSIEVKYGDYLNLSEEEFIKKGKELGLKPNHNSERDAFSNDVALGKIVWHGSGTYVKDETFNYGLSKGKKEDAIVVELGNYVGKSEDDFKKIGTDLGLKPNHKTDKDDYSDSVAKGSIIWHGSGEYGKGETFNYGLSLGPAPKYKVESYAGKTLTEFKNYLNSLNMKLGSQTAEYSDSVGKDVIITNATGEFKAGTAINYTVSLGKDTRVSVTSFAGKAETELTSFLSANNLTGSKSEEYSSNVAEGLIISNDSGTYNSGDTIRYKVSLGVKKCNMNAFADIMQVTRADDYQTGCNNVRNYLTNQGFTNISFTDGEKSGDYGAGVLLKIMVNGTKHVSYNTYNADASIVCTVCTGHLDD